MTRMANIPLSLEDRYRKREGSVLIGGVQALVRLMLLQAERDRAAGLNTAGFVSGYRGSPLGTLDSAFASAKQLTDDGKIVVQPAVNEELAATAVAGTQQIHQSSGARVDGVFSLWYGKGPGLDRASDAVRHGNTQGSSPNGGVVLAVGDDHLAKSSSITCYSDETVAALQLPLLYPADPREIVSYGLHGFAMSRLTGSWVALKILTEVADSARVVAASELEDVPVLPDVQLPATGLHNRWPDLPLEQEARQQDHRLPAVLAYVRANRLDRTVLKPPGARIGLIAAGKSWLDLREALDLLALDETRLTDLGIALYKPAMTWPLEPLALADFTAGLEILIVVEEKAPLIERQVKALLYGAPAAPAVWGKRGPEQQPMFPTTGDLTPECIAAELAAIILRETGDQEVGRLSSHWHKALEDQRTLSDVPASRRPFFCSGCPHNRSTVVPDGSRALGGIGCHGLAARNRPDTFSYSQMGGEGIHWMGVAPFTDEPHIFSNMGDGTYFHSGLLAIRQAVAAKLNITYKLLYNSAVAMTGGQAVDGERTLSRLLAQLRAEGVRTVTLVTEAPAQYRGQKEIVPLVDRVLHRDELNAVQHLLRTRRGVSVIVYDQMCATERRRKRKRGKMEGAESRAFINALVCEGCGDCSTKSNCLSVEPMETPLGTKRRINQSTCNADLSCINGFCPSFVTLEGAEVRRRQADATGLDPLLPPAAAALPGHTRLLLAGVGGTGIVTTSAVLATAGHLAGREAAVLDQIGMAQKGGAVTSHVHIGGPVHALRIPAGQSDLVLACDQIVGNSADVMASLDRDRTRLIANADVSITGDFVADRNAVVDTNLLARRIRQRVAEPNFIAFPFSRLAESLFGDSIAANFMMVGLAYQKGWLPLGLEDLRHAIELNRSAAEANLAALEWGRRLAVDPGSVYVAAELASDESEASSAGELDRFAAFLREYQDDAYARRFLDTIARIRAAESAQDGDGRLTMAAARSLFKLMTYKDEYEVARLYTSGEFERALRTQFETHGKLSVYLAPPFLARRDKATGQPRKIRFGPWVLIAFRVLAALKGLRGRRFDLFGQTSERRTERALIVESIDALDRLNRGLTPQSVTNALRIAQMPLEVRGYGHVKQKAIDEYRRRMREALAQYEMSAEPLRRKALQAAGQ